VFYDIQHRSKITFCRSWKKPRISKRERIAAGGNLNYQDASHGSALVAAINNNDVTMIQYLIDHGADVNAENTHGIVPIEIALHHATDEVVRLLAWSGAKLHSRSRPHWRKRLEECLSSR
tara:strand:+ start:1344 stop:1703 length:360 start_codon:yes stop_codon:yes gene_type:complete